MLVDFAKKAVKHSYIRWLLSREASQRGSGLPVFDGLPPDLWGCGVDGSGDLTIGGVKTSTLAADYGTPLQVINERELLRTFNAFLASFEAVYPNVTLATSYKTNPVPHVLKTLHAEGSHAEVISHFELWLALDLGVDPERIILNGPGKDDGALSLAIEKRVNLINIDGFGEISKIAQLARAAGIRQRVGLRVTTSIGWSSQFGLSIADGAALAAFEEMLSQPELLPVGLHLHLGTGIQDIGTYVQAVGELIDFSERLKTQLGIDIEVFDLGGGFGVPTVRSLTEWDDRMVSLGYPARLSVPHVVPTPEDYAVALKPLLQRVAAAGGGQGHPSVVFEPGRAITSGSQCLLLSVLAKKGGVDGKEFLIVDGGKNISMPLGWETHQIFPANKMNKERDRKYDIFGPLCHPGDVIVKNRVFPEIEVGDILSVMDAGAYFIPNQMNFSNPRPAIVSVTDGKTAIVRRREKFEDIVSLDRV